MVLISSLEAMLLTSDWPLKLSSFSYIDLLNFPDSISRLFKSYLRKLHIVFKDFPSIIEVVSTEHVHSNDSGSVLN